MLGDQTNTPIWIMRRTTRKSWTSSDGTIRASVWLALRQFPILPSCGGLPMHYGHPQHVHTPDKMMPSGGDADYSGKGEGAVMTDLREFGIPELKNEGESIAECYISHSDEERILSPLTVGQLIKSLQQFPVDQRVLVRGYESGYDDPSPLTVVKVRLDPYDSSVYGNYESADDNKPDTFSAVLIDRP